MTESEDQSTKLIFYECCNKAREVNNIICIVCGKVYHKSCSVNDWIDKVKIIDDTRAVCCVAGITSQEQILLIQKDREIQLLRKLLKELEENGKLLRGNKCLLEKKLHNCMKNDMPPPKKDDINTNLLQPEYEKIAQEDSPPMINCITPVKLEDRENAKGVKRSYAEYLEEWEESAPSQILCKRRNRIETITGTNISTLDGAAEGAVMHAESQDEQPLENENGYADTCTENRLESTVPDGQNPGESSLRVSEESRISTIIETELIISNDVGSLDIHGQDAIATGSVGSLDARLGGFNIESQEFNNRRSLQAYEGRNTSLPKENADNINATQDEIDHHVGSEQSPWPDNNKALGGKTDTIQQTVVESQEMMSVDSERDNLGPDCEANYYASETDHNYGLETIRNYDYQNIQKSVEEPAYRGIEREGMFPADSRDTREPYEYVDQLHRDEVDRAYIASEITVAQGTSDCTNEVFQQQEMMSVDSEAGGNYRPNNYEANYNAEETDNNYSSVDIRNYNSQNVEESYIGIEKEGVFPTDGGGTEEWYEYRDNNYQNEIGRADIVSEIAERTSDSCRNNYRPKLFQHLDDKLGKHVEIAVDSKIYGNPGSSTKPTSKISSESKEIIASQEAMSIGSQSQEWQLEAQH